MYGSKRNSAGRRDRRCSRTAVSSLALLAGLLWGSARAWAQQNQLGGQDRADAARQMIILGVQQGISALPPVSGQAFNYEFDPASDTFVRSERLGPTVLRSPETIGADHLSLRLATSYFGLGGSFGPIPYRIHIDSPVPGQTQSLEGLAELGLNANAKVGLINLAATYGITQRIDVHLNLPIVIVDAQASQVFTSTRTGLSAPPSRAKLAAVPIVNGDVAAAQHRLDTALQPGGPLVLRDETFSDLGFAFNEGTHAGVGRIDAGAKGIVYSGERVRVACTGDLFFPSPSEANFAGSASGAFLPRVVAAVLVTKAVRLHLDVGYDLDFAHDELRGFTWDAGTSIPGEHVTFDFGFGGTKYNQGIQWTPPVAKAAAIQIFPAATATALNPSDTRLGDNFAAFLAGVKVRLTESLVLSGAVSVPVTSDGFQAAAIGTLALEYYR